jgi:hypothetical protein
MFHSLYKFAEILTGLTALQLGIQSNHTFRPIPAGWSIFGDRRHSLEIAGSCFKLFGFRISRFWCLSSKFPKFSTMRMIALISILALIAGVGDPAWPQGSPDLYTYFKSYIADTSDPDEPGWQATRSRPWSARSGRPLSYSRSMAWKTSRSSNDPQTSSNDPHFTLLLPTYLLAPCPLSLCYLNLMVQKTFKIES